jgi:hypothetical protein
MWWAISPLIQHSIVLKAVSMEYLKERANHPQISMAIPHHA